MKPFVAKLVIIFFVWSFVAPLSLSRTTGGSYATETLEGNRSPDTAAGGNNPPQLSDGSVTPTSGDSNTIYIYTVSMTDIDNDYADIILHLDGGEIGMGLPVSGVPYSGAIYQWSTSVPAGATHAFYFEANDGKGGFDRLPETGAYSGPSVTPVDAIPYLNPIPGPNSCGNEAPGEGTIHTKLTGIASFSKDDSPKFSTGTSDSFYTPPVSPAPGITVDYSSVRASIWPTSYFKEIGDEGVKLTQFGMGVGPWYPDLLGSEQVYPIGTQDEFRSASVDINTVKVRPGVKHPTGVDECRSYRPDYGSGPIGASQTIGYADLAQAVQRMGTANPGVNWATNTMGSLTDNGYAFGVSTVIPSMGINTYAPYGSYLTVWVPVDYYFPYPVAGETCRLDVTWTGCLSVSYWLGSYPNMNCYTPNPAGYEGVLNKGFWWAFRIENPFYSIITGISHNGNLDADAPTGSWAASQGISITPRGNGLLEMSKTFTLTGGAAYDACIYGGFFFEVYAEASCNLIYPPTMGRGQIINLIDSISVVQSYDGNRVPQKTSGGYPLLCNGIAPSAQDAQKTRWTFDASTAEDGYIFTKSVPSGTITFGFENVGGTMDWHGRFALDPEAMDSRPGFLAWGDIDLESSTLGFVPEMLGYLPLQFGSSAQDFWSGTIAGGAGQPEFPGGPIDFQLHFTLGLPDLIFDTCEFVLELDYGQVTVDWVTSSYGTGASHEAFYPIMLQPPAPFTYTACDFRWDRIYLLGVNRLEHLEVKKWLTPPPDGDASTIFEFDPKADPPLPGSPATFAQQEIDGLGAPLFDATIRLSVVEVCTHNQGYYYSIVFTFDRVYPSIYFDEEDDQSWFLPGTTRADYLVYQNDQLTISFRFHYGDFASTLARAHFIYQKDGGSPVVVPMSIILGGFDGSSQMYKAIGTITFPNSYYFDVGDYIYYFALCDYGANWITSPAYQLHVWPENTPPILTFYDPIYDPAASPPRVVALGTSTPVFKLYAYDPVPQGGLVIVSVSLGAESFQFRWDNQFNWFVLDDDVLDDSWTRWEGAWGGVTAGVETVLVFRAQDAVANTREVSMAVYKDAENPRLFVDAPIDGQGFNGAPAFSLTVTDLKAPAITGSIRAIYYTFDPVPVPDPLWGGWYSIFDAVYSGSVEDSPALFEGSLLDWWSVNHNIISDGLYTVTFIAFDEAGNPSDMVDRAIYIDRVEPLLIIDTPVENAIFKDPPAYHLRIHEDIGLVEIRCTVGSFEYTIPLSQGESDGQGNYVFQGVIDWPEWITAREEWVGASLEFFVRDIGGSSVGGIRHIGKDNLGPRITISTPVDGAFVGSEAPFFVISVVDPHLTELYYSIDKGVTLVPIALDTLSGTISQALWDKALIKSVEIWFVAKDSLGSTTIAKTSVVRTDYLGPGEGGSHEERGDGISLLLFFFMAPEVQVILGIEFAVIVLVMVVRKKKQVKSGGSR